MMQTPHSSDALLCPVPFVRLHLLLLQREAPRSGRSGSATDMFMMMPMTTSVDQTYQTCRALNYSSAWLSQQGAAWAMGEIVSTTYNHVSGPNSRTCAAWTVR